jgi:tight adherence protein C
MLFVALAFMTGFGLTVLVGFTLLRWWPAVGSERLAVAGAPGDAASILRGDARELTGWRRTIERLGRAVTPRDGAKHSRYRQRLVRAGFLEPYAVSIFLGVQVAVALVAGYSYTLYGLAVKRALPDVVPVSIVLACLGFFLPDVWLRRRTRARQQRIVQALPDVLDCLMVCVEAGMAFDAAVARVASQPDVRKSPLHQELLLMHLEMRAGRPREEALRALAERAHVEELTAMIGAFIQSTRLGTPLGKTLRIHSDAARVQRRYRAEQRAHLAPVKMIFPTVLFLMPAFFLVAMAPSLLQLMAVFKSLAK